MFVDKIEELFEMCSDAYLRNEFTLRMPKHTDPKDTYQWRYLKSIAKKFDEWKFDNDTAKKFINIAVEYAKSHGIMKKGLAILHQNNMLKYCYNILTTQLNNNSKIAAVIKQSHDWFQLMTADCDQVQKLLERESLASFPNIIKWYRSGNLPDIYIAISKPCREAINNLDGLDRQYLPTMEKLYSLRLQLQTDQDFCKKVRTAFEGSTCQLHKTKL